MSNLVELRGITRVYRSAGGVEVRAVKGIDMAIKAGEFNFRADAR